MVGRSGLLVSGSVPVVRCFRLVTSSSVLAYLDSVLCAPYGTRSILLFGIPRSILLLN